MSKTETVIMDGDPLFSGVHARIREHFREPAPNSARLYRCEMPLDQEMETWDYLTDPGFHFTVPSEPSPVLTALLESVRAYGDEIQKQTMDALNRRVLNVGGV